MSMPSEPPLPESSDDARFVLWLRRTAIGAIVAMIAVPVWIGVRQGRQAATINECREHLKRIGLALNAYHDRYKSFPPAYVVGADGNPWHSWRVL